MQPSTCFDSQSFFYVLSSTPSKAMYDFSLKMSRYVPQGSYHFDIPFRFRLALYVSLA